MRTLKQMRTTHNSSGMRTWIMVSLIAAFLAGCGSASSPAPVAPAAPVVDTTLVVVPLPVARSEYCNLLNIEFEIDREVIQLDEQEKLAVLASFLERYPETNAVIEGHTDSVGEAELNQQLSERRAQSVVDYLVSKHQIARSRLVASGQGELRPIADNRTQDGKRANRRISAIVGCATDFAGLEQLPARITIAMHLEFDTDSAFVMPKYYAQLGSVARFLEANPATVATVEGHTDSASPDMALQISRQRAQNIASVLIEQFGVDPSRLKVQGFGSTRKVAYNISAEGRQQNRRANIIIDYPK